MIKLNRIKELRQKEKLTQEELANKIGVTKRTIIAWEKGERQIKPDKTKALAAYFGVSVAYLLGYSDVSDKYRDDEILIDNGEGGFTSLSSLRHNELQEEYKEHVKKEFITFLRSHDLVLSDNEIQATLEYITKLNVNSVNNIDYKRIITEQAGAPRKYLLENGYKELGDLFQSSKGINNFYKEKGHNPDYTF